MITPTAYGILGFFTFGSCCCGLISIRAEGSFHGTFIPLITTGCLRLAAIIIASVVMSYLTSISEVTDKNLSVLEEA